MFSLRTRALVKLAPGSSLAPKARAFSSPLVWSSPSFPACLIPHGSFLATERGPISSRPPLPCGLIPFKLVKLVKLVHGHDYEYSSLIASSVAMQRKGGGCGMGNRLLLIHPSSCSVIK